MDTKQRNRKRTRENPAASQVVYTPSKPFQRKRLFLALGIIAAVVLALVFSLSIFFEVKTVSVTVNPGDSLVVENVNITVNSNEPGGVDEHMRYAVYEASGIREGDSLLGLSKAKISSKILQKLVYVDSVQIRIKLPDTVNIEVTTVDITYAVEAKDGSQWLVSASGRVVGQMDPAQSRDYTQIIGVKLDAPQAGQTAKAYEPVTGQDDQGIELPTAQRRLEAALYIADAMENLGLLEGVEEIDASDVQELTFTYENRLTVTLGDDQNLFNKISTAVSAIAQLNPLDSGILDVSFRIQPSGAVLSRETTEN